MSESLEKAIEVEEKGQYMSTGDESESYEKTPDIGIKKRESKRRKPCSSDVTESDDSTGKKFYFFYL